MYTCILNEILFNIALELFEIKKIYTFILNKISSNTASAEVNCIFFRYFCCF